MAVSHHPNFYRLLLSNQPDQDLLQTRGQRFLAAAIELAAAQDEPEWSQTFAESDVNGWLANQLPRDHADLLPDGVSAPRVELLNDVVRLAVQVDQCVGRSVLSCELRPSVVDDKLRLEISGVRCGAIPLRPDHLLLPLQNVLIDLGCNVVAPDEGQSGELLITLPPGDEVRPRIKSISIENHSLVITGTRERLPRPFRRLAAIGAQEESVAQPVSHHVDDEERTGGSTTNGSTGGSSTNGSN
jgi:hypothetical protein